MDLPAGADGLHGVVLSNFKLEDWQVKDLACFAYICKGQLALTGLALVGDAVDNDSVGLGGLALPGCPFWPPVGFWPAARNDFGAGLLSPSLDEGLLELRLFMFKRDCNYSTILCKVAICSCIININASFSA